jgi:sulfite exporter TauE/SafE
MNDTSPRICECSNYAYLDSILLVLFNFGPFGAFWINTTLLQIQSSIYSRALDKASDRRVSDSTVTDVVTGVMTGVVPCGGVSFMDTFAMRARYGRCVCEDCV